MFPFWKKMRKSLRSTLMLEKKEKHSIAFLFIINIPQRSPLDHEKENPPVSRQHKMPQSPYTYLFRSFLPDNKWESWANVGGAGRHAPFTRDA